MARFHVNIVSAEGHVHAGETTMVVAPAVEGELGITPRHAPLLTRLKPGELRVRQVDGSELSFIVGGGILEIQPTMVTVLADLALRGSGVDEAAAMAAKERAEHAMSSAKTEIDFKQAQAELAVILELVKFTRRHRR